MVFVIKTISDYAFRELNKKYIFVVTTNFNGLLQENFPMHAGTNGFLAYVYIDHKQGMGLEVLCTGNFNEETKALNLEKKNVLNRISMPLEAVEGIEILLLPDNVPILEIFSKKVKVVDLEHDASETLLLTRNVVNMDSCRRFYYPDDIEVQLVKNEQIESCFVRVEGIEKFSLYGTLLDEPRYDFGVHQGDLVTFFNVRNERGIMCIAMYK